MPVSGKHTVHIKQTPEAAQLSRAQKQFNTLIKKIETQKIRLLEWENTIPEYNRKVSVEYEVLWEKLTQSRIEHIKLLDRAHDSAIFTKKEQDKIHFLVCRLLDDLVEEDAIEAINDLYMKYQGTDVESTLKERDAATNDLMKSMIQEMFNLDIPDDLDISTPEKMEAYMRENLLQQEPLHDEPQATQRKKSAKQLKKDTKQQEEAQNISKSIQEVYRKLVKTLHPDREQDEKEREYKTEMMRKVNVAYGKKDLLQLLELQLKVEQIDQTQINTMTEDRLKYFNKILKEQLAELNEEIEQIEMSFKIRLNLPPHYPLSPIGLLRSLQEDIAHLKKNIVGSKAELDAFKSPHNLKQRLKEFKLPRKSRFN